VNKDRDRADEELDEIPLTTSTRVARVAVVVFLVAVDLTLAGAGVFLIDKWRDESQAKGATAAPIAAPATIARAIADAPPQHPPEVAAPAAPVAPTPSPAPSPAPSAPPSARDAVSSAAPRVAIPGAAAKSPSPPRDVLPRGKSLPSKPSDPGVMKNPHAGTGAGPEVAVGAPPPPPPPPPPAPDPAPPAEPAEPDDKPDDPPPPTKPIVEQMTAGIRRVVDGHKDSIVDCYRRATKGSVSNDPLRGRLEVHLRILPAGDAEDVRVVQNETGSVELGDCLVAMMKTWRYPGPGADAMEFVWPFTFTTAARAGPR
jgi:hypothetical protein